MSGGFQTTVNNQPGVGEAGDFYGVNPRAVVLAGPGEFNSPSGGVIVGHFVWADADTGNVSASYVAGYQLGFLRREGTTNTVIVQFLGSFATLVLSGFPLTLYSEGDFWASFAAGATPGQSVYADPASGAAIAGASGGINAATLNASIGWTDSGMTAAGTTLTLPGPVGLVSVGDTVSSATITDSPTIISQLSGTPGGAGTYQLSSTETVGSGEAATGVSHVLSVNSVSTGALGVGSVVAGSGITSEAITALGTGTGGAGTYVLAGAQQQHASEAMTVAAVATPWIVNSVAANGELAIISSWG
jgi:hypothetical protein